MSIRDILKALSDGKISIDDAEMMLKLHKIEYVEDIARLDVMRELRRGVPEIVYAEGKEYDDIIKIALRVLKSKDKVVISRVRNEYIDTLVEDLRSKHAYVKASKRGRIVVAGTTKAPLAAAMTSTSEEGNSYNSLGTIGIITAGTSDIGVAEEARLVAESMGCKVITGYDAGVAGLHRLFPLLKDMLTNDVDAIVVVAGMEGALPSVVASLVDVPVIGVPTSVGYGFGAGGVAALTSMLQSCTLGLAVVNIDNGVGAGVLAAMIARRVGRYRAECMNVNDNINSESKGKKVKARV
ncbi:MAG: nickel pincer cofactor biosynthesis protein LarB [Candidatus Nitrosocaldus sp.]